MIADDGKGDVADLADAILAAVDDAAGWPAVINLSLQVHPTRVFEAAYPPNPTDDASFHLQRFPHQALEAALNYARCHGVVVVAAAGNRDGGPDPFRGNGMWGKNLAYPGAYGDVQMGQPWACLDQSAPAGRLAVVVGGIRADGSDASSKRRNGQACLVAPSIALTPDGGPMEGTSFSAATMTGAIAAAWRYAPFASGQDVVGWIEGSAEEVVRGATKGSLGCNASQPSDEMGYANVKRINVCKGMKAALEATCNAGNPARKIYGFACNMAAQLSCSNINVEAIATISTAQGAVLAGTAQDLALERNFSSVLNAPPECQSSVFADTNYRNDSSCPDQMRDNGTINADRPGTSPGSIGCGGCALALLSNGSLWFYGSLVGSQVSSPTLNLGLTGLTGGFFAQPALLTTASSVARSYELGNVLADREPGEPFAVLLAENVAADQLVEASFAWELDHEGVNTAHVAGVPLVQAN